jgi:hypothetical protein
LKAVNVDILERNQKRAAKGFALKPKKQNHKLNHADVLLVFFDKTGCKLNSSNADNYVLS